MVLIPLEDSVVDVLNKAQKASRLSDAELAIKAGVTLEDLHRIRAGEPLEPCLLRLAACLSLGGVALVQLAKKAYCPMAQAVEGLAQFNTHFGDMTVNSYLVWDLQSREAVAFDTGANAFGLMATVRKNSLQLKYLLLTHTHGDHVADVDRILSDTKAEVWVSEKEPHPQAKLFAAGRVFEAGRLRVDTRSTTGHSPGGTTYVISGLARPVAVVGDALFAGSMGGGKVSFADALETNRRQILTLPDDCVLCPGHGPLTTVGEEKRHNPFFPEFQSLSTST